MAQKPVPGQADLFAPPSLGKQLVTVPATPPTLLQPTPEPEPPPEPGLVPWPSPEVLRDFAALWRRTAKFCPRPDDRQRCEENAVAAERKANRREGGGR